MQTETKGTVLIKSAAELTDFSRGEETQLENQIKVNVYIAQLKCFTVNY